MIGSTRRAFLATSSAIVAGGVVCRPGLGETGVGAEGVGAGAGGVGASYPETPAEDVRAITGRAHFDLEAVRGLLERDPMLAHACWDWGYGDWETPLGAASHTGRVEIVALLLDSGATPTIFSATALNQVGVVRALCEARPGIQRVRGPHAITLMDHARFAKATDVGAYLEGLGGADEREEDLPITEEEVEAISGTYSFGDGAEDAFEVKRNSRGRLGFDRVGGTMRFIRRTGDRTFGVFRVPSATIEFGPSLEAARTMTVTDVRHRIVATRVG